MIVLLARLGSPEIAGQFALGLAVSAPILVLAQFRRPQPGASDIRITSLVLALLGIAAVGFLDHGIQDRMALVLIVLADFVEWVADLYAGQRGTVSLALHGILPVAALTVVFGRTGHLGSGVLAVLIVRLLVLFCYDFKTVRREPCTEARELQVARLAGCVPCYFIAHMLGYRALGIFASIASLAPVANGLVQALGHAVAPKLKRFYDHGDLPGFSRLSAQLGAAGLMLGLCAIAGAALFGSYTGQQALLVAVSAVAGGQFVATLLGCVLTAGRRGQERMPLEILAVAVTALACVALVPRAGLLGAASAVGLGFLVQAIGQVCVLGTLLRHPRPALLELLQS
jgi:hypothetical protein